MARIGFLTIEFFASSADYVLLSEVIFKIGLAPAECGMLQSEPRRWSRLSEIRLAGNRKVGEWATGPDANQNQAFILTAPSHDLKSRSVLQNRTGQILYSVGILENPESLYLSAGGLSSIGCLIPSKLSCFRAEGNARAAFGCIRKYIISNYTASADGHYWVWPDAARLARGGARLCTDSRSSERIFLADHGP